LLAEVHVFVGGQLVSKFAVETGEYIIGRDATCHIIVDADQVSRHHARLTFSSFELLIEDLGSSNGVFIDGVQVQIPTRVRPDQEVQIGSARLFLSLHQAAQEKFRAALWDKDLGLESVRQVLAGPKYKIVTTIARGGMGVIMQARDLCIRRTVAMKVMKTASQFSRENVLRFIDEAQLTGQLEHPNIVPVYELGLDEHGETFYTMKYVRGITLDEVLRGLRNNNAKMARKYPLGTLLTIFQKICDGVAYAHAKGVVHRDLKPENVMIGSYGEVLVMDWGLAKNVTGLQRLEVGKPVETLSEKERMHDARGFQTMHGLVVGTPPYISPEQARGELERIDPRSDIYVLGGILYAILCLRAPVAGNTVAEVIDNILASNIAPPSNFNAQPKTGRRTPELSSTESVPLPHLPGGRIPDSLSAVVMKANVHGCGQALSNGRRDAGGSYCIPRWICYESGARQPGKTDPALGGPAQSRGDAHRNLCDHFPDPGWDVHLLAQARAGFGVGKLRIGDCERTARQGKRTEGPGSTGRLATDRADVCFRCAGAA
jgi:serine/threonine protein kinase